MTCHAKRYAPLPRFGSGATGNIFVVSAHHKGIELVAVWIPEIGGIKSFIALAGRAFTGAAERHGLCPWPRTPPSHRYRPSSAYRQREALRQTRRRRPDRPTR